MVTVSVTVLLLAACSDDGEDASTDSPAASTTTAGGDDGSTTTALSLPQDPDAQPCGPQLPEPDGDELAYHGLDLDEFNAANMQDLVVVYLDDDGWHIRADLTDGRGTIVDSLTTVASDTASIEGAVDLDGDGPQEVFVVVAHGASAQIYGFYDLDGCDLEAIQFADGSPAELPVGGSVLELHGLRCEADGSLTALTATSEDGVSYTGDQRTYALTDGILTETGATPVTLTADDPALTDYTRLAC